MNHTTGQHSPGKIWIAYKGKIIAWVRTPEKAQEVIQRDWRKS